MRLALESVVTNGTGRTAFVEEYRVGGKTGTAQKVKDGKYLSGDYIMSFIATVPADKPQAVLYVAIDNPKNVAALASVAVTPVAKKILIDIIRILEIPKGVIGEGKSYQSFEKKYYEVPNVIGMNLTDAKKLLTHFQVEYTGNGQKIIAQSPNPKERQISGGKLRLLLGD